MATPLEDPTYDPVHKPLAGIVPSVVEKWGPRSQVRWFKRFRNELYRFARIAEHFYTESVEHKGDCCWSCVSEKNEGYHYLDDCCCCRSER